MKNVIVTNITSDTRRGHNRYKGVDVVDGDIIAFYEDDMGNSVWILKLYSGGFNVISNTKIAVKTEHYESDNESAARLYFAGSVSADCLLRTAKV